MPGSWWPLGLLSIVATALILWVLKLLPWQRITAAERERRRCQIVNRFGRTHDAFLTDASAEILYYSYSVNGVDYAASQDCAPLLDHLPPSPETLVGHVHIKYLTRNPANSILLSDTWCGIPERQRKAIKPPKIL
jgi:hypothetical protein